MSPKYYHLFPDFPPLFKYLYALGLKFPLKEPFLKTLKHTYFLVKVISPKVISSGSWNNRWWTHSIFQVSHKAFWFLLGAWGESSDYGGPGFHNNSEIGQDGCRQASSSNFHKNSASKLDCPTVLLIPCSQCHTKGRKDSPRWERTQSLQFNYSTHGPLQWRGLKQQKI